MKEYWGKLKPVLKWYISPYLTTLITLPMLIVQVGVAISSTYMAMIRSLSLLPQLMTIFDMLTPRNLGIALLTTATTWSALIFWQSIATMPNIWRGEGAVSVKILRIAGVFLGSHTIALLVEDVLRVAVIRATQ